MNNAPAVPNAVPTINYSDERMIKTIKATVAQNATDDEFAMFAELCKSTGLNPFKREIWFIKAGGKPQIMTGINGYLAIANRHPQYDGMEVDVEMDAAGNPTKAVAKVYRKDRSRPSVGIALVREYRKDTPTWRAMPSVMIQKVAKSIALREAFPQELGGLYTFEEMPAEYSLEAATTPLQGAQGEQVTVYRYEYAVPENLTKQDKRTLFAEVKRRGARYDEATKKILSPAPIAMLEGRVVSEPKVEFVDGDTGEIIDDPLPDFDAVPGEEGPNI